MLLPLRFVLCVWFSFFSFFFLPRLRSGTPTRNDWPGMVDLPEYKTVEASPRYEGKKLAQMLPRLSKAGLDLIERMLQADPQKRITARDAMRHPYFAELNLQGTQPPV